MNFPKEYSVLRFIALNEEEILPSFLIFRATDVVIPTEKQFQSQWDLLAVKLENWEDLQPIASSKSNAYC